MRIVRKTVVLAFAGFGIYKTWGIANEKLANLRRQGADAKARIEPALHDTEETVATALDDVSESLHELSPSVHRGVCVVQALRARPAPIADLRR